MRIGWVLLLMGATACDSTVSPTPTPSIAATASPTPAPTPSPLPTAVPGTVPVSGVGSLARVVAAEVHAAISPGGGIRGSPPPASSTADVIRAGELVQVTGGPVASGGTRWWEVTVGSLRGWVAEGTPDRPNLIDATSPLSREWNVWSATATTKLSSPVADLPERVYVPNEANDTISVIDVASLKVIATLPTGRIPEHLTPDWDMSRLYVSNYASPFLSVVDPRAVAMLGPIKAQSPYNLYFSPDGSTAIVMAEDVNRIDFYDRRTWHLLKELPINWAGIDHADFSAGGRYLLASTEYAGHVLKVDVVTMSIVGDVAVGGLPIDVKLSPDGSVFFVANQGRSGVSVVDPFQMKEIAFIPTGNGAHGMAISRDTQSLYVSNRLAGTISVIDFATRKVTATWKVGGSPDMLQVSTDGTQLWTGNRFDSTVVVINTASGKVIATIRVGRRPHGLTFFPQPGRFSIGHNGVYR